MSSRGNAGAASILFYAVDLDDLRSWVGRGDPAAVSAALAALQEDEDEGWAPADRPFLERMLRRIILDGELYSGLADEDRYGLTQVLIDLFDEFVDSEAASDEWPLAAVEAGLADVRRSSPAGSQLVDCLLRGRELDADRPLVARGVEFSDAQPYFGFVTRLELESLESALKRRAAGLAGRPAKARETVLRAVRLCRESERDLLSFVWDASADA